jgi:membrane associated rhomboid family serine protease
MIPLSDDLPTLRTPWVTYLIVAINAGAWLLLQGAGFDQVALASSVCNYGMVPGELTGGAPLGSGVPIGPRMACVVDAEPINVLTPLTSMFLHGSWGHILSNMLFFWVFGNNIEDSMGHGRFALFYVLCGLAAAGTHVFLNASSPVPTVGASGAISGILGAYLLLYPKARVNMLFILFIFIQVIPVRAWLVLVWWFVVQVLTGLPELMTLRSEVSGGVAVWAHVGGFVAGVALVKLFAGRRLVEAHRATHGHRYGHGWSGWGIGGR